MVRDTYSRHTVGGVASNITPNQDDIVTIDSNTGLNTSGTKYQHSLLLMMV